ncbi:hypothetical protein KRX51_06465 [Corynebacterium sp. TAE3-ERU12]|uniref:hypothetical protein n=1 Tax=Corynebacterium sp. TAE3-ERU12 TaxID=2849491 RepID=UPI001C4726BD|nr:hypothetical protein [Corynebacterium sp. TAE3-ERU12]MBV7295560.1 hypothetical protein [Corynebacterium sp. TAE3-ERU12]
MIASLGCSAIPLILGLKNNSGWVVAPWFLLTVAMLLSWNALQAVTDNVESAPASYLDEYEYERIQHMRALSYRLLVTVNAIYIVALAMVGVVVVNTDPWWGVYVPYTAGIIALVGWMAILSFPAAIFAWNMADD